MSSHTASPPDDVAALVLPVAARPMPVLSDLNRPFWAAAAQGELRLQRCEECGEIRHPIADICPKCLSGLYQWSKMSGRARLLSFVIFHRAYRASLKDQLPYNSALVRLDEGPTLVSNIAAPQDDLKNDMPLEVAFLPVSDEVAIPVFKPVSTSHAA